MNSPAAALSCKWVSLKVGGKSVGAHRQLTMRVLHVGVSENTVGDELGLDEDYGGSAARGGMRRRTRGGLQRVVEGEKGDGGGRVGGGGGIRVGWGEWGRAV